MQVPGQSFLMPCVVCVLYDCSMRVWYLVPVFAITVTLATLALSPTVADLTLNLTS